MYSADQRWPPLPNVITDSLREWDAWYSGDPGKLDMLYGQNDDMRPRVRRSQLLGGLVGATARMFWGQPDNDRTRLKLHMPIAQDITMASADLLFGDELGVEWEDTAAQERMEYVLGGNGFHAQLSEAGELAAALGGVYLRAGWDDEVADHALMSVVHADGAIPEFRYGRLRTVVLWQIVRMDEHTVWRHLETHTPGSITHELPDPRRTRHRPPL